MSTPVTAAHLLTRGSHRGKAADALSVVGDMRLARGRAHEVCGLSRRTLALAVARATTGPVIWIRPAWTPDRLHGPGVRRFIDPGRLLFVDAPRADDLLWSMEEVLRTGLLPLVVADLPGPPGLTAIRRLHLAAETGAAEGQTAPVGLLLTPGDGGAAGVETRWSLTPEHGANGAEGWRLARLRARMAPPADWRMTWGSAGPEIATDPPPDQAASPKHRSPALRA